MQVTTFVGLDIGSATHVLAAVDAQGGVVRRPLQVTEAAAGYATLDATLAALGTPATTLIVCEATGHYWRNVVAHLWAGGWRVALINPLRSARYAEEELARTKTDAIDALGLARFGGEAPGAGARHRRGHPRADGAGPPARGCCRTSRTGSSSRTASWTSPSPSSRGT
jgi:transposase